MLLEEDLVWCLQSGASFVLPKRTFFCAFREVESFSLLSGCTIHVAKLS